MARVVLHDDLECPSDVTPRVVANTDQDCPVAEHDVLPWVTVRVRRRTEYTADGDPKFEWQQVVEDQAVVWAMREELDSDAGVTRTLATAVVLYDGDIEVKETAAVFVDPGGRFRVTQVQQFTDRLAFELVMLVDADG